MGVVSLGPDGKDERKLDVPETAKFWAVPSPDGRRVAYVVESVNEKVGGYLCIAEIGGKSHAIRFRIPEKTGYLDFSWSPDGTQIHACTGMEGVKGVQHYRLDMKGMPPRPLDMLKTRTVDDWAADGKSLVTTEVGDGDQWEPRSIHLVDLDGKEKQVLAAPKGGAAHGQLSPDGKRLLVCHEGGLAVVKVGEPETLTPVAGGPDESIERGEYDWSPDGKRIVFRRQKGTLQEPGDVELVVADPDGKNATVIRKSNADGIWKVYWR
jgi:Tol biopolymer transport system component